MEPTVFVLDKVLTETWTREEIAELSIKYGVEIEMLPAKPWRAVAMNSPIDGEPIYLTWRAKCALFECPYSQRFADDVVFPTLVRRFDGLVGCLITDHLKRMIDLAAGRAGSIVAEMNDVTVEVSSCDTVEERWAWMEAEMDRRHQEYIASPEYKERCRQAEIEAAKLAAERVEIAAIAPARMTLQDSATWETFVDVNSHDGYSNAVVIFAERWARYMEGEMGKGTRLVDCADKCSRLADEEGITGFMYGCAVSVLAKVWARGEDLRRWHNKDVQIGTEGDKANEDGGVLNPALLKIG